MENRDPEKPRYPDNFGNTEMSGRSWSPETMGIPHENRGNSAENHGQTDRNSAQAVIDFIGRLTEQEKMLILLKKELYEGSWQSILNDLNNRLDGKPYIFKLANRIRDDIERIEKLKAFEEKYHLDLAEHVTPTKP
jgi:hypothetical protein